MTISKIAETILSSPTLGLNAKANALRASGEPVIHLGGGEPKSKAPQSAIDASIKYVSTGEVRYTPASGIPSLKKAIVQYTKDHYYHEVQPENVFASGGAKQAIMTAMYAILNPGDEFLYPSPYWVSYPDMARLCGATGIEIKSTNGSLLASIDDIKAGITPKTKCVIINSPNNPSGLMYEDNFIKEVVELCEEKDIYLIMDDIYHRLVFDGKKAPSCYSFAKNLTETSKIIVINGVSKQYAMTGFRLGWAVANKKLIKIMTNIQEHQNSGPCAIAQVAAEAAIMGDQSSVSELVKELEINRDLLVAELSKIEGVKVARPNGTFYCFADFSSFDADSVKLSDYLIEKVLVLTMPGKYFGMDGYLRISYCGSSADIIEGVRRIKWALDKNEPDEIQIGEKIIKR